MDLDIEIPQVIFVRHCADARNSVDGEMVSVYGQAGASGGGAHGSAMRRSVSLMMRFGRAILKWSCRYGSRAALDG